MRGHCTEAASPSRLIRAAYTLRTAQRDAIKIKLNQCGYSELQGRSNQGKLYGVAFAYITTHCSPQASASIAGFAGTTRKFQLRIL
jgi:hypothetical protein